MSSCLRRHPGQERGGTRTEPQQQWGGRCKHGSKIPRKEEVRCSGRPGPKVSGRRGDAGEPHDANARESWTTKGLVVGLTGRWSFSSVARRRHSGPGGTCALARLGSVGLKGQG